MGRGLWLAGGFWLILLFGAIPAQAQTVTLDLGEGGGELSSYVLRLIALITLLSVLPGLAITLTCFPFMLTVMSILRQGIGLQQAPPNMMMVAISLFLTWYVMDPVFTEAWARGIGPYSRNEMEMIPAFEAAIEPFRSFMIGRIDAETFARLDELRPRAETTVESAPLSLLMLSFMLCEIERAFQVGYILYLPFLIIDLVVASVLMSAGMMMVPPVAISLPFKLIFFVSVDGWSLITTALVRSYL